VPFITAIKSQKKRKNRFNIYLDGKFVFGLSAEALAKANLSVGQELSRKEVDSLIFENELGKSLDRVYHFLSYRPRSEKEIRDYLKRKMISDDLSGKVIAKVKKQGYLDDLEFVRWWVEQRSTFRPRGKRALVAELRQKGVAPEIIDKVLSDVVDEVSLAQKAIQKKINEYLKLPSRESRQKIAAYLRRRGFSWETIEKVFDKEGIKKGFLN